MSRNLDLSVIIPALNEASNLAILLPELHHVLEDLGIRYEILIVTHQADCRTLEVATQAGARVVEQRERGYGGALLTGFATACGTYVLTMDADLSHRPVFIYDVWRHRQAADVTIVSRYVAGGRAHMPTNRYLLSRVLNRFFSQGLGLPIRDMSSGFRLYRADALRGQPIKARDFDILQEILVRAYAEGWTVQEVPFEYRARTSGRSHVRMLRFGLAYLRTFWSLWRLRNSVQAGDYDARAYDSLIYPQRYWQRSRYRYITELIAGHGRVLDVGCGSSRIIGALPEGSVALDILLRKLRYARRFARPLVQASGFSLPFRNELFPCVVCSEVIEHVPKDSPMFDELCRVLAPGGRLIVGTPDYAHWEWIVIEKIYSVVVPGGYAEEHISHYTRRELLDMFEKRGFTLEETRYILRGELIMAFRKGSQEALA